MKPRTSLLQRLAALAICAVLPMSCNDRITATSLDEDVAEQPGGAGDPVPQPWPGPEAPGPVTPKPPQPQPQPVPPPGGPGGGSEPQPENPPVPEPGTLLLVGTGLAAIAMMRRRTTRAPETHD